MSLPLLHLTSNFRHILSVGIGSFRVCLNSSSGKTRGWAVEMPFQVSEGTCHGGDGTLWTGTAACLWPLPGSLWDCSAGFLQRGAEDIVGVRDAGQRFQEKWQASRLLFFCAWKSWQVKSSPQIWETVCWNNFFLVCHFPSPGPNKIPGVADGDVSDSLLNLCVLFRVLTQ